MILRDDSGKAYQEAQERLTPAEFKILTQRILDHTTVEFLNGKQGPFSTWITTLVGKINQYQMVRDKIVPALSYLKDAPPTHNGFDKQKYLTAVDALNHQLSNSPSMVKDMIARVWPPHLLYYSLNIFMTHFFTTHLEKNLIQQLLYRLRVHCHESICIVNTDV
jgi:hypothetical protein